MLSFAEVKTMPMPQLFNYAKVRAPKNGGNADEYNALHELIRLAGRREEYMRHQKALLRSLELDGANLRKDAAYLISLMDMESAIGDLRPVYSSRLGMVFEEGAVEAGDRGVSAGELVALPPLSQIFLLHHDWTKVLEGTEADEGDVMLPYPACLFEASIGAVRVAVAIISPEGAGADTFYGAFKYVLWEVRPDLRCVDEADHRVYVPPPPFWVVTDPDSFTESPSKPTIDALLQKARLACIALESGLAETVLVPAPEKLNKARLRSGKPPIRDCYVVDIAKRYKAAARATSAGYQGIVRAHLRRSHWWPSDPSDPRRRYHPWTKVGNEALGWVHHLYKS